MSLWYPENGRNYKKICLYLNVRNFPTSLCNGAPNEEWESYRIVEAVMRQCLEIT